MKQKNRAAYTLLLSSLTLFMLCIFCSTKSYSQGVALPTDGGVSIFNYLLNLIPVKWQGLIFTIIGILYLLEQWLAKTDRFKANSTFQVVGSWITALNNWIKGKSTIIIIAMALVAFSACKVAYTPRYDASAISQVHTEAILTDNIYTAIQSSSDKSFASFQFQYQAVQIGIDSILVKDSTRAHSATLVGMVNRLKKQLIIFTNQHWAAGTLTNSQAEANRLELAGLWGAILRIELSYKQ